MGFPSEPPLLNRQMLQELVPMLTALMLIREYGTTFRHNHGELTDTDDGRYVP